MAKRNTGIKKVSRAKAIHKPPPGKASIGTRSKPNLKMMAPKGGGNFRSEAQRRYIWVRAPKAARKLAHNIPSTKADWRRRSKWYDPAKDPNLPHRGRSGGKPKR